MGINPLRFWTGYNKHSVTFFVDMFMSLADLFRNGLAFFSILYSTLLLGICTADLFRHLLNSTTVFFSLCLTVGSFATPNCYTSVRYLYCKLCTEIKLKSSQVG